MKVQKQQRNKVMACVLKKKVPHGANLITNFAWPLWRAPKMQPCSMPAYQVGGVIARPTLILSRRQETANVSENSLSRGFKTNCFQIISEWVKLPFCLPLVAPMDICKASVIRGTIPKKVIKLQCINFIFIHSGLQVSFLNIFRY